MFKTSYSIAKWPATLFKPSLFPMAQIRQLDSAGRVKLASSWVLNSPAAFPKGQIMSWLFPGDKVAVTLLVLWSWLHLWLRLQCGQVAGTYAPASAVPWLERSCKIGIPQIESTRAALGSEKEVRQIFRWGVFLSLFLKKNCWLEVAVLLWTNTSLNQCLRLHSKILKKHLRTAC